MYTLDKGSFWSKELNSDKNKFAFPEIMIPLVSTETEIKIMKDLVIRVAGQVEKENKVKVISFSNISTLHNL